MSLRHILTGEYPWVREDNGLIRRNYGSYRVYLDTQKSFDARFPAMYRVWRAIVRFFWTFPA